MEHPEKRASRTPYGFRLADVFMKVFNQKDSYRVRRTERVTPERDEEELPSSIELERDFFFFVLSFLVSFF